LEVAPEDVLGRSNGPHTAQLGNRSYISSNHAKVTFEKGEWFITELRSTNKTFVNSLKLEPATPFKIKQDDVVMLANETFIVRERK
jgi:pSer/pThr/pTyr-binding forkhead associated (FHA) protein